MKHFEIKISKYHIVITSWGVIVIFYDTSAENTFVNDSRFENGCRFKIKPPPEYSRQFALTIHGWCPFKEGDYFSNVPHLIRWAKCK
jgi:hypothetical protein